MASGRLLCGIADKGHKVGINTPGVYPVVRRPEYIIWCGLIRDIANRRGVKVAPEVLNFDHFYEWIHTQGFEADKHSVKDISAYTRQHDYRSKVIAINDFVVLPKEQARQFISPKQKRDLPFWVNETIVNKFRARVSVWSNQHYLENGAAKNVFLAGDDPHKLHMWAIEQKIISYRIIADQLGANENPIGKACVLSAVHALRTLVDKDQEFRIF